MINDPGNGTRPARAVVTGATSGLGYQTAWALAAQGMEVVLAVRDAERGARAAAAMLADGARVRPEVVELELSDLVSVRAAARRIAAGGPVDVLVNNAGVSVTGPRQTTQQGFELQMGVNHLAHFVLTAELMDALRQADRPRVVSVSSLVHRGAGRLDPSLGSGPRYRSLRGYSQSKLVCGLFGLELARRARAVGSPLVSVVTHPGWTATSLFRPSAARALGRRLIESAGPNLAMTTAEGAQSQIRGALDPALRGGEFLGPRWVVRGATRQERPARNMRDEQSARIAWERSEELTGTLLSVV